MTDVVEIVQIVLPVFLVIGAGYLLGLLGFIRPQVNDALSRLVFFVAAPALLLRSASLTPFHEALHLKTILLITGVTILTAFVVYLLLARSSPGRRGVLAQGAHRSNMVFVGLPVVANAYGEDKLGTIAVTIGFMVIVYNVLAVLLLTLPHQKKDALSLSLWKATLLEVLRNPLILGCGAGIVLSASGCALPVAVDRTLEMIGRIAMPLALLSVGASLNFKNLRIELGSAGFIAFIKLLLYPALVYAGLKLLGVHGLDLYIPVLIMAAPTAVVSCIMAKEMNGDEQLAAAVVLGTTLFSLITLSAWLAFFRFFPEG